MKQIPKSSTNNEPIDEYEIISLAKKLGISTEEMKDMSFTSLLNILISSIDTEKEIKATEDDVRRMFG